MSINDDFWSDKEMEAARNVFPVGPYDCPNNVGYDFSVDGNPYKKIEAVTRLHYRVTREDPMPWEEGTDYADYFELDLPYEVKIEPGKKAWSIFEQAVIEAMEIVHSSENGPQIVDQYISLEQIDQKNWYCEDLAQIGNEQLILGNKRGSDAVKEYDWFCVAVEGESCHHGNGWHSGCVACDQEENEVK